MMPPTVMTTLVQAHQSDLREQADQARMAKLARHGPRRPRIVRRSGGWQLATEPVHRVQMVTNRSASGHTI